MHSTTKAKQYARLIYWSEEDSCYIGSLPEICGNCCHADTPEELHAQLDTIAQDWVDLEAAGEVKLPPPHSFAIVNKSRYSLDPSPASSIAALRRASGLSQAAFAAALGLSKSTIAQWEQGHRKPDKASAKLLAIIEKHPEALFL